MDPEDLREVISAYQKCVAETVKRFGGFVAKYMGDGVLIYFGYPKAHEDDAERAVRAGLELVVGLLKRRSFRVFILPMGRPLGAKNKRTLLREANMREAAARAQFDLAMTDDESIKADSLAVMEDAMTYFYRLALKERHRNGDADPKAIRDAALPSFPCRRLTSRDGV